jgi:hypothetical protein
MDRPSIPTMWAAPCARNEQNSLGSAPVQKAKSDNSPSPGISRNLPAIMVVT